MVWEKRSTIGASAGSLKRITQSEEKFKLLLQNSFDIITVLDEKGNILFESDAVEPILGYKPEERIGKNIFKEHIVHPLDRHIKEDMFQRSLKSPGISIHAEFRMFHKEGGTRVIDAVCSNLLGDKTIHGIIATYHDITERKQLEKQKDDFIGIASHELKTPVTSIKAYAEILQEKFKQKKDKPSVELARKMEKQVDRLTVLISDLLDVTKISEGQLKLSNSLFSMPQLIKEKAEEIQQANLNHKIQLKLNRGPRVWGDAERTGQVLLNLLSNAVKYSPPPAKIIIRLNYDKEKLTVSVQDSGIGFEPEFSEKIFGRFFRVNDPQVKNFPGMGLGLYISAEIVKRQKGIMWAESKKGKGSTFYFSLPLKR